MHANVSALSTSDRQLLQEGVQLLQAGRGSEAASRFQGLLAREPRQPDALHYLGLVAYQAQQYETAAGLIGASIAEKSDDPAVYSNLGNALTMLNRLSEAETAFRRALELNPQFADAWFNIGNILRQQQRFADADGAYRNAIALMPSHAGALNNLANVLMMQGRAAQAAEAYYHLGNVLQDIGRTAEAGSAYRQAQAAFPNPGIDVALALLTPAIPMSVDEIDAVRSGLSTNVAALAAAGIRLPDPLRYASPAIFYTGYHGRNDRELRKQLADFYAAASPELTWRAPHCTGYAGPAERMRIGFVSKFFYPQHPMIKLYGGIADQLDRARFDVTVFRFDAPGNDGLFPDTPVVVLPTDLGLARQAIGDARLDVLFYTDVGMEPTTYFLAFARLAPVQCVTLGHPVTTGIANMDYFLSAHHVERADAQEHYTEKLIRLDSVPNFVKPPSLPATAPTRADFGLPADAKVYFCAQNVIKYHPEFDAALGGILRRDPNGVLVLIDSSKAPQLGALLRTRFQRSIPDVLHRVRFLPYLNLDALLGFARSVDAVLDTPGFGGGTTSLEMFAVDVPIVTWPGPYARSRITRAFYREMEIDDLAASNAAEYVELAFRLANDGAWREAMRGRIRERKHVLYEDYGLVRELERFFTAAVGAASEGREIEDWKA